MNRFATSTLMSLVGLSTLCLAQEPAIRDLFSEEYDAILYGIEKNSGVGFSMASGDINGDGLDDLIIGAPLADSSFSKKQNNAGLTYVYFGRSEMGTAVDLSSGADLVIHGASKGDQSGFDLATGDLNGDGIQDLIIAAPEADSRLSGKKQNDSGITYIIFGRKEFADAKLGLEAGAADAELHSTLNGEYSASALATGDFNGDGIDDIIVGSPFTDRPQNDIGVVYLVLGRRDFSGQIDLGQNADCTIRGLKKGDRLGLAIGAGDLNGDGIDDLVLGALEADGPSGVPNVGSVTVLFGRQALPRTLHLEQDTGFVFSGTYKHDFVGTALAVGDLNGDEADDLIVGVPYADLLPSDSAEDDEALEKGKKEADAGKVFVFYGGPQLGGKRVLKEGADAVLLGTQGGTNYGDHAGAALGVGDLNGDGYADLVLSAPLGDVKGRSRSDEEQMKDVGAVFVKRGGSKWGETIDLESGYSQVIFGAFKNDFFGGVALTKPRAGFGGLFNPDSYRKAWMSKRYDRFFSKSIATGDFNGDGIKDLAVGAPAADGPRIVGRKIDDAGAVYLFWGSG